MQLEFQRMISFISMSFRFGPRSFGMGFPRDNFDDSLGHFRLVTFITERSRCCTAVQQQMNSFALFVATYQRH